MNRQPHRISRRGDRSLGASGEGPLRAADKVIVVKDGLVREEGAHEHLLLLGGVYAGLHKAQEDTESAAAVG
jgi:hypothetical protein